jgi:hypothetical protein
MGLSVIADNGARQEALGFRAARPFKTMEIR